MTSTNVSLIVSREMGPGKRILFLGTEFSSQEQNSLNGKKRKKSTQKRSNLQPATCNPQYMHPILRRLLTDDRRRQRRSVEFFNADRYVGGAKERARDNKMNDCATENDLLCWKEEHVHDGATSLFQQQP